MKWLGYFQILALLALGTSVRAEDAALMKSYRQALSDYVTESEDYLQTMKSTSGEVRTWRSIFLSERFESRLQSLEKTLIQSNQQIIAEVDKAIKEGGMDSLDDVLLMRMAQLQFERESLSLSQKMKTYEFQLKAFLAGRVPKAPELPTPDYKLAIEYAKALLTRYPRSPLSDKAHYVMAYALEEMGQYDAAIEIYKRFLRRHPFSPLVDEIKWRVGEFYFDNRDLNKAAFYYLDLMQKQNSTYRLKALYKLGATYFAGQKFDQAAQYFASLYKETKSSVDDVRENETLYDESLEYLGIIQSFGVKLNLDQDARDEATKRLARAYQRLPNEGKARTIYLDFMRRETYSPRVPPFSNEIIQSYLSEAKLPEADMVRDKLVSFLTRDNKWWKENFKNRRATFEAEDLLEEYLIASAESHAQRGFEKNDQAELKVARDQYLRFLRSYPFSKLALRARFEMAQVEYFAGLYPAAQESFEYVMNDPAGDAYLDDAAYGYLLSNIKRIGYQMDKESTLEAKRAASGELLPPQTLNDKDKTFLAAAQVYTGKIKSGARRQKVLYKVAEIHFQNNNFELSQKAIDMILEDKTDVTLTTAKALRLSAEIANIKGDWQAVAQRNNELMSLSFSSDVKGLGDVNQVTPGAQSLESAARLEAAGKKLDAAHEYDRIALGLPHANFSPHATWKAAQLYRDEGKYKDSQDALDRLKGTDYDAESQFLRANNLKSLLNFQAAAEAFESFVKKYSRHQWAPEALFSAASLRRDLKQYKEAVQNFLRYYDYKQVDTVLFESMDILSKQGDLKAAQSILGRVPTASRDGRLRGRGIVAEGFWRKKDYKSTGAICKEIYDSIKATKSLSAQAVRARSLCQYYEASLGVQKQGLTDKVTSVLKDLDRNSQTDLAARLYTDIGQKLLEQGNQTDAFKNFESGWTEVHRNPYTEEGRRLYDLMVKLSSEFPTHVGMFVNWNLDAANYFQWLTPATQQMVWGNARSICDREIYEDCLKQVEEIAKAEPSEEMLQNKVIAYLRSGYDVEAFDTLKSLGEKSNWANSVVRFAVLIGAAEMIPIAKRSIEIPEQMQRAEGFAARAELYVLAGKYKEALKDLQDSIKEDPEYHAPYIIMARLFHETGHYELMREVLHEATRNTKTRGGLFGLSLIWDSILNPGLQKRNQEPTDQYDSRALYGLGLSSVIIGDAKTAEAANSLLDKRGTWGQDLKYSEAFESSAKPVTSIGAESRKSSRYSLFKSFVSSATKNERLQDYAFARNMGVPLNSFLKDYEGWLKK